MNLLPTNLGCLANVTATQSSKFAMTGVYVSVKEDGYTVAATDSKSLAVVTGKAPADVKDYPAMPEIEYAPNSQSAAIVPAKSWSKHFASAKKLTAKCHKELLRTVPIVIGERVTTMGATNLDQQAVETSNNVEGRFPPYQEIIPKAKPTMEIKVDAKRLAELLKVAAEFTTDEYSLVTISLYDPSRPIMVTTNNHETQQKFTGMVMPMA